MIWALRAVLIISDVHASHVGVLLPICEEMKKYIVKEPSQGW